MRTLRNIALTLGAVGIVYAAQARDSAPDRIGSRAVLSPAVERAIAEPGSRPDATVFDTLSPEDRALARSVFAGQLVTPESEPRLSMDQIASARRAGGWELVFVTLKAGRLTDARDAADLVRSARWRAVTDTGRPPATGRVEVVETGAGRPLIFHGNQNAAQPGMAAGRGS